MLQRTLDEMIADGDLEEEIENDIQAISFLRD